MTQPKILTPAEALRALADGRKLRHQMWKEGDYFYLHKDGLENQSGDFVRFHRFSECVEYTEPTPKVVWVEYLCFQTTDGHWPNIPGRLEWYTSPPPSHTLWTYTPTGRKIEV